MVTVNLATGSDVNWHDTPSALVVAHPGHQVRLHGWLELARPRVFILTDGSGRSGRPRLDATSEYLASLRIEPGAIYGQHTDRAVYQRVLGGDSDFFVGLTDRLAESLARARVRFVAGDAAEGYNSIHDLCRLLTDAAVALLDRGGEVASFDYPVINRPDDCPAELRERSVWLRLDDETFSRKLEAARAYYPELLEEVRSALRGNGGSDGPMKQYFDLTGRGGRSGLEAFSVECLRPVAAGPPADGARAAKPFYEVHGERQVEAGLYDHVIRYREHIAPIAERLWRHVT